MRWRSVVLVLLGACGRIDFEAREIGDARSPDMLAVPNGLVAHYPMDSIANGLTPDVIGHHDATCEVCPTAVAGRIGGALAFDGSTQIMRVTAGTALNTTSAFTVTAWIQFATTPPERGCFTTKGLGTNLFNSWAACVEASRQIFFYTVAADTPNELYSSALVSTDVWHHIAIRWDGMQKVIAIDGAGNTAGDVALTSFDDQPIYIGSDIDSGMLTAPFRGNVDDLRIYNRALTNEELAVLAHP